MWVCSSLLRAVRPKVANHFRRLAVADGEDRFHGNEPQIEKEEGRRRAAVGG